MQRNKKAKQTNTGEGLKFLKIDSVHKRLYNTTPPVTLEVDFKRNHVEINEDDYDSFLGNYGFNLSDMDEVIAELEAILTALKDTRKDLGDKVNSKD